VASFAALTGAALVALLAAESRGFAPGRWIAKPLASTGFVLAALAAGGLGTGYGRIVVAGLVLCWLGDLLLIPHDSRSFRLGIASFLLGHVAFIAAFVLRGVAPLGAALSLLGVVPAAALALRWLAPHVPPNFRLPVRAYVLAISLMVVCAAGTVAARWDAVLLAGALLFYVSDLCVARDRFVAPGFPNRAIGLPLYYAATLLLAATVRAP
jgi:uncharacterized membrane protein YhhN